MTKVEALSLNVSERKGTAKRPVEQIVVDRLGVVGDAHAGSHRPVSLLEQACTESFAVRLGRPIGPGEFGENITYGGVPSRNVAPLDRFVFGNVELEITQIGKQCHGAGARSSRKWASASCRPRAFSHGWCGAAPFAAAIAVSTVRGPCDALSSRSATAPRPANMPTAAARGSASCSMSSSPRTAGTRRSKAACFPTTPNRCAARSSRVASGART